MVIVASLIGVISDILTTRIGMNSEKEELSHLINCIYKKWGKERGFKIWMGIEAIAFAVLGTFDFILTTELSTNVLFFVILWGVFRGLWATHNFEVIKEGRAIDGHKRRKIELQFIVCFVVLFAAAFLVLFISVIQSLFQVNLFWNFLAAGLVLGVAFFLFATGKKN